MPRTYVKKPAKSTAPLSAPALRGTGTLMVQAPPRPAPAPRPNAPLLTREMDVLVFVAQATGAEDPAIIPAGPRALGMYRDARVLHIRGLVTMTPVSASPDSPKNAHKNPTHYQWVMALTDAGTARLKAMERAATRARIRAPHYGPQG